MRVVDGSTLVSLYILVSCMDPTVCGQSSTQHADIYAIVFLCCGWVAFPLFISQIFVRRTVTSDNTDNSKQPDPRLNVENFKIFLI